MKYIILILCLINGSIYAQNKPRTSIEFLEQYTSQFGIEFAYSPEKIGSITLKQANSLEELKSVFSDVNLTILEIDTKRWLLRNQDESSEKKTTYVRGRVLDSDGSPLVSSLIYTNSGKYSTLTDDDGAFILEIPDENIYQVCCQYLGFKPQCISSDKELAFELEPLALLIDDVEISTKKVQCSLDALDDKEILRLKSSGLLNSALGKDVMRAVQMLGGVDATNDLSASMSVRASSGFQSLVTLDGIPIYNAESAFGMFSVLNPMVVTKAELYKNSMPLEYGEFTGGYLACEGLTNIHHKVKLDIDLNTLQSSGSIQLPLGKRTQVSAAARISNGRISNKQYYSTLRTKRSNNTDLPLFFERPENINTSLENAFADAYLNFSHQWKKNSKLSFSLFGNIDATGSSYNYTTLFKRGIKEDITVIENYTQSKVKANVGMSLRYHKRYENDSELLFAIYSSSYGLRDSIRLNILVQNSTEDKSHFFNSNIFNSIRDNNIKFQYLTNKERTWSAKVGVDFRRLGTNFNFRSNNISPFRQQLEVPSITPYAGIRYNYKGIFLADIGLRNAIIPIKNPVNFASPRAKILVKLNKEVFFKSSISYNQQFFRPIELERQLGQSTSANIIATNRNIPIMKSAQITMGGNYFKNGFKLNGDLFLRENTGILEQVLTMPGLGDGSNVFANNSYKLFSGTNKVIGLDITSSYEKGRFMGLLSYTISKSEDNFEELFDNKPIPDQNNRTHQWNLFASYELNAWSFSTTYVYGSGLYTLDRSALDQNVEREDIDPAVLFKQLPAYNRWDVSVSRTWNTKLGDFSLDVGIYNFMNSNNVNSELDIYSFQDENKTATGGAEVSLLGRIWTLGLRYGLN
ncbi:peptidase associated domain and porin domain-containing protein [Portibacter lacus]|uniref:TonB-dependent receptor n=1 Tax=Portibacter lacus TaxID=1099794 RepID=A0AA37SU76_9BACT|nr:TonB-dependent receptor plug domain-containing protein [Portibacter lacus]GLR19789.1 TonB-dependent receptor [Portibacter lacus]